MKSEAPAAEDPAVTIRRLRQRLYVVEPVYRAAVASVASYRNRTSETSDLERAVDRAIESERMIANGWSISDLDLRKIP